MAVVKGTSEFIAGEIQMDVRLIHEMMNESVAAHGTMVLPLGYHSRIVRLLDGIMSNAGVILRRKTANP